MRENKKKILFFIAVLAFISTIFLFKNLFSSDALVEIPKESIQIEINGMYEGEATANAILKKYPEIKKERDPSNIEKHNRIMSYLNSLKVELDPKENLKNGDEVKATLIYPDTDLKIDGLEKVTIIKKVEGLLRVVEKFSELNEDMLDKIEKRSKHIVEKELPENAKNIKIEKEKSYYNEKIELSNNIKHPDKLFPFGVYHIYKVTYDVPSYSYFSDEDSYKQKSIYFLAGYRNLELENKDKLLTAGFNSIPILYKGNDIEHVFNKLKASGFSYDVEFIEFK